MPITAQHLYFIIRPVVYISSVKYHVKTGFSTSACLRVVGFLSERVHGLLVSCQTVFTGCWFLVRACSLVVGFLSERVHWLLVSCQSVFTGCWPS